MGRDTSDRGRDTCTGEGDTSRQERGYLWTEEGIPLDRGGGCLWTGEGTSG